MIKKKISAVKQDKPAEKTKKKGAVKRKRSGASFEAVRALGMKPPFISRELSEPFMPHILIFNYRKRVRTFIKELGRLHPFWYKKALVDLKDDMSWSEVEDVLREHEIYLCKQRKT